MSRYLSAEYIKKEEAYHLHSLKSRWRASGGTSLLDEAIKTIKTLFQILRAISAEERKSVCLWADEGGMVLM